MTETPATVRPTTIDVYNPADGTLAGQVINESPARVVAAVQQLRHAQTSWEAAGPRERIKWLMALQDWILDNARHISDVLQSETGKSRADASVEVPLIADALRYWTTHAERFLRDDHPRSRSPLGIAKKLTVTYRPHPVVGIITPWNAPFVMAAQDAIPALAAGASVLVKPSEVTPLSAVEFARGWREIGAPPVVALATGDGVTGAAVVDNVDFIQFTGSTRTGRAIAQRCTHRLIPYSLELGGKDPALVFADADLDRAANGIAWGGMVNAGQVCISVERVYVEAPVYDEFVAKLTQRVADITQGQDTTAFRYDIGALATSGQRDIVQRHVDDAVADGATIRTGGKPTGVGTFFAPTVLTDVEQSMSCITEETFGPTLPVIKVADEAEAIRLANDSRYGLSASVWTGDRRRGERVARQLNVGAVNINDALANPFIWDLPMGGWKESGVGARSGGAYGIRKYCRPQAITAPRIRPARSELLWYPTSRLKSTLVEVVMRATAARGRRRFGL
jgi:acyl-CoA reductase-like NAD-dependent aldehyde dehydrogenase